MGASSPYSELLWPPKSQMNTPGLWNNEEKPWGRGRQETGFCTSPALSSDSQVTLSMVSRKSLLHVSKLDQQAPPNTDKDTIRFGWALQFRVVLQPTGGLHKHQWGYPSLAMTKPSHCAVLNQDLRCGARTLIAVLLVKLNHLCGFFSKKSSAILLCYWFPNGPNAFLSL